MQTQTHNSQMHDTKLLLISVIWNKLNAITIIGATITLYIRSAALLILSAWSTDLAMWVDLFFAVTVGCCLLAFNIIRLYRLWRNKDKID